MSDETKPTTDNPTLEHELTQEEADHEIELIMVELRTIAEQEVNDGLSAAVLQQGDSFRPMTFIRDWLIRTLAQLMYECPDDFRELDETDIPIRILAL